MVTACTCYHGFALPRTFQVFAFTYISLHGHPQLAPSSRRVFPSRLQMLIIVSSCSWSTLFPKSLPPHSSHSALPILHSSFPSCQQSSRFSISFFGTSTGRHADTRILVFVSMILTIVRAHRGDTRRESHHTFVDGNDFYGAPRTGINESESSVTYQLAPRESFARPASRLREMEDSSTTAEHGEKATL